MPYVYQVSGGEVRRVMVEMDLPETRLGFVYTTVIPDTTFHDPVVEETADEFTDEDGDLWI